MIAPLRTEDPDMRVNRKALTRARRVVAVMFPPRVLSSASYLPSVVSWKAWLASFWIGAAVVFYLVRMFGLLG